MNNQKINIGKSFSVVIPVYNEAENILRVYQELKDVELLYNLKLEIIFINDGSTDTTQQLLETLSDIKFHSFGENLGQTEAFNKGIKMSTHPYLFTMDGDGQNDPVDFLKFIEFMELENLDMIVGWRFSRNDTLVKKFISRVAYFLRKIIFEDNIHDSGCSLKLFRTESINQIELTSQMHRFIPILMKMRGFKVGEIKVNHRKRFGGKSKYSMKRIKLSLIDLIYLRYLLKYSKNPLYAFGKISINLIIFDIILGIFSLINWVVGFNYSKLVSLSLFTIIFISAINFFTLGIILDKIQKK